MRDVAVLQPLQLRLRLVARFTATWSISPRSRRISANSLKLTFIVPTTRNLGHNRGYPSLLAAVEGGAAVHVLVGTLHQTRLHGETPGQEHNSFLQAAVATRSHCRLPELLVFPFFHFLQTEEIAVAIRQLVAQTVAAVMPVQRPPRGTRVQLGTTVDVGKHVVRGDRQHRRGGSGKTVPLAWKRVRGSYGTGDVQHDVQSPAPTP